MSGLYISTSRKPSMRTRRLARWLHILFGGTSENRGKRSVREMLERARSTGFDTALLIYEDHGNPSQMCFLTQSEWLPCILIKSLSHEERAGQRIRIVSRSLKVNGETGKKIARLIERAIAGDEDMEASKGNLVIHCTDRKIYFTLDKTAMGPVIEIAGIDEPASPMNNGKKA